MAPEGGPRKWHVRGTPGSCPQCPHPEPRLAGGGMPCWPRPRPETCLSGRPTPDRGTGRKRLGALAPPSPAIVLRPPAQFPHSVPPGSHRHKGCGRGLGAQRLVSSRRGGCVEAPELPESQGLGPECPRLDASWDDGLMGRVSTPGAAAGGPGWSPHSTRPPAVPPHSPWGLPAAPPLSGNPGPTRWPLGDLDPSILGRPGSWWP